MSKLHTTSDHPGAVFLFALKTQKVDYVQHYLAGVLVGESPSIIEMITLPPWLHAESVGKANHL